MSFSNNFGYCVNNFCPSAIRTSLWLSKMDSTCPKEHFEAKKFFLKIVQISKLIRTLNNIKFGFLSRKSRRGRQSSTLCFCWNITKKSFASEKVYIFLNLYRTLVEEISAFCRKKLVRLPKRKLTCPLDQFEQWDFFWKIYGIFITFGFRATNFQHFVH